MYTSYKKYNYVSKNVKYLKQKFSLKRNYMKHILRIE